MVHAPPFFVFAFFEVLWSIVALVFIASETSRWETFENLGVNID